MEHAETEYVYEPFADTEEYMNVNRNIIREWIDTLVAAGCRGVDSLLDLGSGVGTMVQLFMENLPRGWAQPSVVCVDMCEQALEQAQRRLGPSVRHLEVIACPVEKLELPQTFDAAMWGNGIHYLDESNLLTAMRRIHGALKEGGWFFFNSAFTAESRPAETMPFYRAQIAKAIRYLKSVGAQREKSETAPQSSRFLPTGYYEAALKEVGFAVRTVRSSMVRLYQTAWEHISGFAQYAAGALHGYRDDLAAEAMRRAVEPAIQEYGRRDEGDRPFVPRGWTSVIARRVNDGG